MKNAFDSVREYTRKGCSVIPLRPRGKKAAVAWKILQQRKATSHEVENWPNNIPNANIGIVTGQISGVMVIECDSTKASDRFVASYPEAKNTLQARTGRGKHFYFRWSPGVRSNAASLGRKIDVRAEGAYVVAPPSI